MLFQTSERFRTQIIKFPGLMSSSTVIWFQKWPLEALIEVSKHSISKYEIETKESIKFQLIDTMAYFHHTVFSTCKDYFDR